MKSETVDVNDIELAIDRFGATHDPAILLLMGNSAPGLVWPDRFCEGLAGFGYHVIRYDQRDTGLSTQVDFAARPYTLHDLVDDALGLLDRLDIGSAHLVGLSQGGNVACLTGLKAPERVASITTIMSSPDLGPKNDAFTGLPEPDGGLPRPAADYVRAVIALNSTPAESDEAIAWRFVENFRLAAGLHSPFEEAFWLDMGRAVAARRRAGHAKMANHSNHSKAQMATAPLTSDDLARLARPCLVIHGTDDPIFPPAHAEWAIAQLPNAELCVIQDMGHALDPAFFEPVALRIRAFLTRIEGR